MFGLICRSSKEAVIFCVLNNRTKPKFLPIIQENITKDMNEDNILSESLSTKTREYSDSFSPYQIRDFKRLGSIYFRYCIIAVCYLFTF